MSKTELEKSAELLAENLRGFEERTLQRIGNRIKRTGQLSAYDRKTIDNLANLGYSLDDIYKEIAKGGNAELYQKLVNANIDINKLNQDVQMLNINGDIKIIQDDLDAVLEFNKKEVRKMYEAEMTEQVKRSQALYKATGTPFIPYGENAFAQQLVKNWATITAGEMLNLSRSKVTGFKMDGGKTFMPIDKAYQQAMDKAIVSVRTGTTDFYTAMRDVMTDLGGGVVNYDSGVTRSLDSVARSNILYGAKQSAQQYQDYIGEQFGSNGFEVDWHPHPRPWHEEIGGGLFALGDKDITINGVTYKSEHRPLSNGLSVRELMAQYGCLHFTTSILLGISEPTYDSKWLEEQKAKDKELIEYTYKYERNGKTYEKTMSKTRYEWQQKQRELERMGKAEKVQAKFAQDCGDNIKAKEHNQSYRQIRNAYDDLCKKVGLTPTPERMAVYTSRNEARVIIGNVKSQSLTNIYGQNIEFNLSPKFEKSKGIITELSKEYDTRLLKVQMGAEQRAGTVDISGATMNLSSAELSTSVHEFAHTLSSTNAQKYGLVQHENFWKEIKSIYRKYKKEVGEDSTKWISAYAHTGGVDEFFAEAFTHAKMRQLGLKLSDEYGTYNKYADEILEIINKYFKKRR